MSSPLNKNDHSSEWLEFRSWFETWFAQEAAQRLADFDVALKLLRPRVARSALRVRRGLAVLPDEASCRDRILSRFLALERLPENEFSFHLWLDSQILHTVKEEQESTVCSLDCLNPAWQELRCSIHRLARLDRRTLLHALIPFSVDFPEAEPDQGSRKAQQLWQEVSADFPVEAIPEAWNTEPLEHVAAPKCASALLEKGLFSGESEANQRDRFLIGSLAKNLYELGLRTEAKVDSSTPLILNPALLRADDGGVNVDFLRRWRDSARPLLLDLGIPEEVLSYLGNLSKAPFGQGKFQADSLLLMAGRLGYSKSNVLYSLGARAMRAGDTDAANRYFEEGMKCAGDDKGVAAGLANLAVVEFEKFGPKAADQLLQEARKACSWSRLVRANTELLKQYLRDHDIDAGGLR